MGIRGADRHRSFIGIPNGAFMATKQAGLIDSTLRRAKAADKPYNLYDTGGLYLTVATTGAKWWRLKYRFAGKERRMGLGTYPDVSLAGAREARDKARIVLRSGKDPGAIRRTEDARRRIAADNTFEAIALEWLAKMKSEWVASQFTKEKRRLELHAFPWLGKMPISDIAPADVRPVLDRLVKRGTVDVAHRVRQQISSVFRHAAHDDRVSRDPADNLKGYLPEHTKRHYSALTKPDDVADLLRAIDGFKGQFATLCALRLAPMFFVRPGELRAAEWSEVDLDRAEWVIPPSRRKLRKKQKANKDTPAHIVPLSTQAIAVLKELHPLTGHGQYVFPGARSPRVPMSNVCLNAALRRMGFSAEQMTPHGFRHMASTMLHEQGWNPDAIERQLSHKAQGIRAVYNKAEHLDERRRMMQAWADYLEALRSGADIVPIKRSA